MSPELRPGDEIRIRGEGGAYFDHTVPDPATHAGELFALRLSRQEIVIVDEYGDPLEPQPTYAPHGVVNDDVDDDVPVGPAKEILAWVGDDLDRADRALDAELGRDKPRAGLVARLEALILDGALAELSDEERAALAALTDEERAQLAALTGPGA
jgi:hypothetical protein